MIPYVIILIVIAVAAFVFYRIWYVKKHGIEVEGVISRIEEGMDSDSSVSYTYYVRYVRSDNEGNGQTTEALLSNPGFAKGLEVGARIKIKYLPEKPNMAVWVK